MIAPTILALAAAALVSAEENPYSTFPSVAKTATINGFADPIYSAVAPCAQLCLEANKDTGSTPCPYWDTGCLCIMPQFGNKIADCIASGCQGGDVKVASDAAVSACLKAGVWEPYWHISAAQVLALASAAGGAAKRAEIEPAQQTEAPNGAVNVPEHEPTPPPQVRRHYA